MTKETNQLFRENYRVLLLAVVSGIILLLIKLLAAWLSNATSILSDALESVVNVVAGIFGLYALRIAHLPKDKNHPYGHGKIEFIAAAFEGGLLFLAGLGIIGKAVYHIIFPQTIRDLQDGLLLVALAGVVNFILGILLERKGRRNKSLVLIAGGKHLLTDAYSSLALLAGAVAVYLSGLVLLDNLIAIVFGLFLLYTGFSLLRQSLSGILDEADMELIEGLVAHIELHRKDAWIDVHNLRVIKYGSKLHVDCHVTVPWYYTVLESHQILEELEQSVKSFNIDSVEVFIHADPCQSYSCSLCALESCPQRQASFKARVPWSLELLLANAKHKNN